MVTDYVKNKVKKELGIDEDASQAQVCLTIDRKRSKIRGEIDVLRQEMGECSVDPITLLNMHDHEFQEHLTEIELLRNKSKSLHDKLNELNLNAKILSCETKDWQWEIRRRV